MFDNDGAARQAIQDVYDSHGSAGLDDEKLMSSLLSDLLSGQRRETALILAASRAGVATRLTDQIGHGMPVDTAVSDISSRLAEESVLEVAACRWVVGEYAAVLGHAVSAASDSPHGPAASGANAVPTPVGMTVDDQSRTLGDIPRALDTSAGLPGRPGPDASAAAIELVGVAKEFTSHGEVVAAVNSIDLAIERGEFFSLLGPSGCGKTTTMRMIAGFEEPTRGYVLLHGQNVTGVPPNRRDVNMVFQSYALFPHMSVEQNVSFGLEQRRVPKPEIRARVGEILEIVGLTGREKRRPRELSGGQQQRVALARALVNRPSALLLDEPLGALDLKLRQAMQVELKRIQREVNITFVYVTHDQGEALTMSDRIAVMNEGAIEHLGSPRAIYENPRTRFVAGFIGTSNLLDGRAARVVDGNAVIEIDPEQRIVVPVRDGDAAVGDQFELTVRPEKIRLRTDKPGGADGSVLRGVVTEVVYLGTATNYNVTTSTGSDVVVFTQNAANADDIAVRGDDVWLTWEPQHSYAIGEK